MMNHHTMSSSNKDTCLLWNKPLSPSRTIITSFTPRRTRVTTTTTTTMTPYEEGDWVLCLTTDNGSGGGYNTNNNNNNTTTTTGSDNPESLACALSNGEVQVYDTQRLHLVRSFQHYVPTSTSSSTTSSTRITDLHYGPQHSLISKPSWVPTSIHTKTISPKSTFRRCFLPMVVVVVVVVVGTRVYCSRVRKMD